MVLADAIDPRYRLLVLLAVFASLRWGKVRDCRRPTSTLVDGLVHVERSIVLIGAEQVVRRPKTAAGTRTIAFPRWLLPLVEAHFHDYSNLEQTGRCSSVRTGRRRLGRTSPQIWRRAITTAGQPGSHRHDLRHTGNHFAAMSGASTRELMGRMGHISVDAAMIYQHRTASRDRAIADALDRMVNTWTSTSAGPSTSSAHEISGHVEGTNWK